MTPIYPGTARRLGLRKPQPSITQGVASMMRKQLGHLVDPRHVYVNRP